MKIVLQHPHAPDDISGVLTSINELLPDLRARHDVEVQVVSTKTASAREQIAAVLWADALLLNSNCLLMAVAGRVLFRRTVLKLHYPQYQTVHWNYVPMSFSRRMTTELRHLATLRAGPRYITESIGRLFLRTAVALIVDRVSACSRHCADQSSLPRNVVVLRNPIRIANGLPPRTAAELDRPFRFVFIGRITHEKGWDTLVDAVCTVAHTSRRFQVDIIGTGNDLNLMKERVIAAGLADRFSFHGRLDTAATLSSLRGALAVVMPSRVQETAGYIPLEAASQRVASIVAQVGGLPETAGPECPSFRSGDSDDLASLMIRYLDNPSMALAAGYSSYVRAVSKFSPGLIASELMQILDPHQPAPQGR